VETIVSAKFHVVKAASPSGRQRVTASATNPWCVLLSTLVLLTRIVTLVIDAPIHAVQAEVSVIPPAVYSLTVLQYKL
jgi:hypothetical protein